MKITADQLRQAIDALPDPEHYRYKQIHIPLPPDIDIMQSSYTPDKRTIQHELIFTLGAYKEGYRRFDQWAIDLDTYADIKRSSNDEIKRLNTELKTYMGYVKESNKECKELRNEYISISNKWYVKFAFWLNGLFK